LESLTLKAVMSESEWPTLVPVTFSGCSEKLVEFNVWFVYDDSDFRGLSKWTEEDYFEEGGLEMVRGRLLPAVQEEDLPSIFRRQQPCGRLTTFSVDAMETLTMTQIQSIFEQCPGLISLVIPQLHSVINTRALAHFIAERCPQIQKIDHS
jgi:hypothetical protein